MAGTQIHNGPSKWDLILALFDSSPNGKRRAVFFQSEDGDEVEVVIQTVKCNQSSDYVFAGWIRESLVANIVNKYVVGNYNTQRGKGELFVHPTEKGLPRI